MESKIKVGSQFSGVGAFEQSLNRIGIDYENIYAADWDKYARQTYLLNFEEPEYYVKDVYDTPVEEITQKHGSLDLVMFSPPCQAFSLAGKRKGEDDKRGILFYNSHEFIQKNKPRYFIFENVKGLLSDDSGKTFQRWIDYLGGKSVNGNPVLFPHEESIPYHVYYQVLNAKHYGIPQNRERIFIIGIRDDEDNNFSFPKPFPLEKRLKDVLESEVDEKYFLSDKMLNFFSSHEKEQKEKGNGFSFKPKNGIDVGNCITARYHKMGLDDNYVAIDDIANYLRANAALCPTDNAVLIESQPKASRIIGCNPDNPKSRKPGLPTEQMIEVNEDETVTNTLTTVQKDNVVVISTNNSKGFDLAEEEEDSINFSNPNSETRRGRVGKKVSQTLDTQCNQGIVTRKPSKQEINSVLVVGDLGGANEHNNRVYSTEGISPTLLAGNNGGGQSPVKHLTTTQRIRRLTPTEAFRLMDFNFGIPGVKDFVWDVSDSQAYRQAGNSICVGVLVELIKKLNL